MTKQFRVSFIVLDIDKINVVIRFPFVYLMCNNYTDDNKYGVDKFLLIVEYFNWLELNLSYYTTDFHTRVLYPMDPSSAWRREMIDEL